MAVPWVVSGIWNNNLGIIPWRRGGLHPLGPRNTVSLVLSVDVSLGLQPYEKEGG